MNNKLHIKSGDTVMVLSGKDKGKKGKVLSVNPDDRKVLVEGVSMASRAHKAEKGRPAGRYPEKRNTDLRFQGNARVQQVRRSRSDRA